MVEDGSRDLGNSKNSGERVLSQEEIDNLLGFTVGDVNLDDHSGIRAIIDSAMVSYERLPMLEIVFDRLVRLMTTSLRNFTSDNVEVSLDRITSVRFGDYMNSIPLPAVLSVFKAEEWENFGLATVDSSLIYSMVDVLLGGRRGQTSLRIEGRPYTSIETNLVKRLVEVVLADGEQAFRPLSPVTFTIDRLETNPRFAAISRPANAAILVRLRIDMEDRGGNIELLLPYATIEPIRNVLLQMFMGEKFGRDPIWEGHFATEVAQAEISVDAVLYEADIPLKQLMKLKVGDTPPLEMRADALVTVRCGNVTLTEGRMGRVGDRVAIRVTKQLRKPNTTFAMFEKADADQDDGGTMNHSLGIAIESLVAVLLMLTVGYCMLLNKRLQRLKADEHSLKATIAELITATEIAERAIGGLKHTVRDVNENLGSQLTAATQMSAHLKSQLAEGDGVIRRLSKIAIAARPLSAGREPPEATVSSAKAVAAAAQAFSERRRANGLAA
jgi:flagellar motor switch protein FliM